MPSVDLTPGDWRSSARYMSGNVEVVVSARAARSVVYEGEGSHPFWEAWQKVIDDTLIEWDRNPDQFDDDGVDSPTAAIIQLAIRFAREYRDKGMVPPDSVVPDVNGGIVFERRDGELSELIHVWDDGEVEYQRFEGSRLVERQVLMNTDE